MMKRVSYVLPALAAILTLFLPPLSHACMVNPPAEVRVKREFDAVVVIRITRVTVDMKTLEWDTVRPWEAVGSVERTIVGKFDARTVEIGRSGISSMCDDGHPSPKVGDVWVAYMQKDRGKFLAYESYPLALSRRIDPRFTARHP